MRVSKSSINRDYVDDLIGIKCLTLPKMCPCIAFAYSFDVNS